MQRRSYRPQLQGLPPQQVNGQLPGSEPGSSFGWQDFNDPFLAQNGPPGAQQHHAGHPQQRYGGGPAGVVQGDFTGYGQAHSSTRGAGPAQFVPPGGLRPRAAQAHQAGWMMQGVPGNNLGRPALQQQGARSITSSAAPAKKRKAVHSAATQQNAALPKPRGKAKDNPAKPTAATRAPQQKPTARAVPAARQEDPGLDAEAEPADEDTAKKRSRNLQDLSLIRTAASHIIQSVTPNAAGAALARAHCIKLLAAVEKIDERLRVRRSNKALHQP